MIEKIKIIKNDLVYRSFFTMAGFIMLFINFPNETQAQTSNQIQDYPEIKIIEIKRNIPLNDEETKYKDYYFNAGSNQKISLGKTYSIYRKVPVSSALTQGEFSAVNVPVGEVKIIYVDKNISIGRLVKLYPRSDLPVLDIEGIILGDFIDLSHFSSYKKNHTK